MIRAALALVLVSAMYCGSILVAYKIGHENGAETGFQASRTEQVRFARDGVRAITWQAYKLDRIERAIRGEP